ncbi:hypothetical protein O181_007129 [Austropuccinia psidii MF-1]|uniref:Uncharacterized protein n=1 Tax=Austropuccinia psidii MF-1 TaxID=1389203 RepID=A0A9Q3BKD3_9BASI|nr:hypothetical protein [Austropuccinia psidii MF-1]
MDNKKFNLASHWEELGGILQNICLKKISFKDFITITKGWNPNRKFKLLEQRETRIKKNESTIQAIEEQFNQTEPTLIPSGSQGVDQANSALVQTIQETEDQWPRVAILHNPR